jgi:phage recombination protein Bet
MGNELITFDNTELELLKTTIAKGTTDEQFKLFTQVCKQTGLNPFARQIYAVVRNARKKIGDRWEYVPEMSIQTSIDGYRLLAQRSGEYQGQDGPYYFNKKTGEWTDYWLEDYPPDAARVGVLRKGFQKYLYAVARFESYAVREYNEHTRKNDGGLKNLWAKMPEVMIAKVAEALALRRAFPAELSGIYTKEEMDQADMPLPTPTPEVHVTPVHPHEENQEPVQQVDGEVVDAAPAHEYTVSETRTRVDEIKPTSKKGIVFSFENLYQALTKKPYTSDDAISPEACAKMNQYLDAVVHSRENKQKAS